MEKEITMNDLYQLIVNLSAQMNSRFDKLEKEVSEIKQKVNTIEEHVARIDERLTQTEKVAKLFNPEILEKIAT